MEKKEPWDEKWKKIMEKKDPCHGKRESKYENDSDFP